MFSPAEALRQTLVRQVRETFNDQAKGERPVPASDNALYSRNSVVWRVHGDVTSMMVGGVSALLMQMLHPAALAGVWDHSDARRDMIGRLRRTARFIAVTTYGERGTAEAAIAKVRAIHEKVSGLTPGGDGYRADDPRLLAWVHVAGAIMFLDGWRRYAEPRMSRADQDRYFAEAALVAEMLGADPVPDSRGAAERLIAEYRNELCADERTRAFRRIVLDAPAPSLKDAPVQKLLLAAAVDLLPDFARDMHGLKRFPLPPLAVRGATFAFAGTLRWAFSSRSYR
ncbi:MAG TPA: oxygenase MpaB family protein [Sphingomicrobium sp.]|nr:oxygenase MpaB family protein [Sphingomicrobium sp.]